MSTINRVAHGLTAGQRVTFTDIAPADTGLSDEFVYYVLADGLTADAFQVSETDGGTPLTLLLDVTSANMRVIDDDDVDVDALYEDITDPTAVMAPPVAPDAPAAPTLSSAILNSIVRLVVDFAAGSETVRSIDVAVTREFSGATPVWTDAMIVTVTRDIVSLSMPCLGDTDYAARLRYLDVYGNYSDWSDADTHTTVDGSDSRAAATAAVTALATSLINGPATVTIDATGATIEDGALILKDEFGKTVMVASGFSGSWSDFVSTGLYNSKFQAGTVGTVANGRTAALPYWTVSDPDTTAMTLALLASGAGVKMSWSQINKRKRIISDPVPVTGRYFEAGFEAIAAGTVANIKHTLTIHWYDAAMSLLGSSVVLSSTSPPFAGVVYFTAENAEILSTGVVYAKLQIEAQEVTTHSASNSLTLRGAWLRSSPTALNNVSADSVSAGTVSTTGDANVGGDLTVTGGINVGSSTTPVVNNKGTATFSAITSTWVQIGKLVVARVSFILSANGSGATALTVDTGLPQSSGNFVAWGDRGGTGVNKVLARAVATGGSIQLTGLQLITAIGTNLTGADLANGASYSFHFAYISV